MIIEGMKKRSISAWMEPLTERDLFPGGKIPFRRNWSHFEVILNGSRTGVIIMRKKVMLPQEADVAKTKGQLSLLKAVSPSCTIIQE